MSSRTRSIVFAAGAIVCAALAAASAGSYASGVGERYGPLRVVVVSRTTLPRGARFDGKLIREALEARQVPESFAPADALLDPRAAMGSELALELPEGSYLTASALRSNDEPRARRPNATPSGASPVEITVTGAGALEQARPGADPRVDVVVSGDPGPGPRAGRTYVAASDVLLLALRRARAEVGGGADRWVATLALSRSEALRLIRAEGYARSIRLLAG